MTAENDGATRLSRDDWLARALDLLARKGSSKLRIDAICAALGVTKGSFYWHFKDREDFVRSMVQFWSDRFTDPVLSRVSQTGGSAQDRLISLMRMVSEGGFAQYDVSVRAWAAQDPDLVAEIVKAVDKRRLGFVGSLFSEMGFDCFESDMRARACVAFLSYEASVLAKIPKKNRSKMLEQFVRVISPNSE